MNTRIHDTHDDFSASDLLAVTADDAGMRRGLLEIFGDESPRLLARIEDAVESGRHGDVADAAHALKSLVATVGGRRAFALAGDVERAGRGGQLPADDAIGALSTSLRELGLALAAYVQSEERPC